MSKLSFPRSILEFQHLFIDDFACWAYLAEIRWPDGKVFCPKCGEEQSSFITTRGRWKCPLGHQWSVTTDTVMHRSKVPLHKWFWAAYLVTTQTPGISAMILSRQIDVHYETAYMMLQRLRAGMVEDTQYLLSGKVEVDEAYVSAGGEREESTRAGRGTKKPLVVGAVETRRNGELRFRYVKHASQKDLCGFVQDHVEKGSTVRTDKWEGYRPLKKLGYRHVKVEGESLKEVAEQLPRMHTAFGNLKAWLVGTHHGVSTKHLQAYLNEFAFRYNSRSDPQEGFLKVLQISSEVEGPEYEELYSAGEPGGWAHVNPEDEEDEA